MKRMLFNATHSEELRVAIVDGQKLIDIDIESAGRESRKSNIYKGVVTRVEPSLEACFVNYGEDRHGFLPFKEISKAYFKPGVEVSKARIQDAIAEGQELIVQVDKEERGNKGAALTTYISLAGRYLVLMPNNPRGGGVSRRVEGEDRQELRETMDRLDVPGGMSLIARTAGIGRVQEELQWDLNYLLQLWHAIEGAAGSSSGAFLIYQESSLVIRAIRDYFTPDIGEILFDTDDVCEQARQFMGHVMPDMVARVKRYRDHTPLFTRFQIEHQIETAYSRMVPLPSGGAIVIDHTEALVAIDVNSARSTRGSDIEETALRTNLEAADEVARQMRLRDLGGLIVIDFIDMESSKNQREVEQRVKDALHYDRARVQAGKISRFGLMELSRQRLRPALNEGTHITCPRCNGTGVIRDVESSALHMLRVIQDEAMKENTAAVHAQVPVEVATYLLNEKRAEIAKLEARVKVEIVLIPNKHIDTPHYKVERLRHDDERLATYRASYSIADGPSEAGEYLEHKFEAAKPRQEAMVKGITPDQPAPVAAAKPVEPDAVVVQQPAALPAPTPVAPRGQEPAGLIGMILGLFKRKPAAYDVPTPIPSVTTAIEVSPASPVSPTPGGERESRRGRTGRGEGGGRSRDGRGSREGREPREAREGREPREAREGREPREAREAREAREGREPREAREGREPREAREGREPREAREGREPREAREGREPREAREGREPREAREGREPREAREGREPTDAREGRRGRGQRRPARDASPEAGAADALALTPPSALDTPEGAQDTMASPNEEPRRRREPRRATESAAPDAAQAEMTFAPTDETAAGAGSAELDVEVGGESNGPDSETGEPRRRRRRRGGRGRERGEGNGGEAGDSESAPESEAESGTPASQASGAAPVIIETAPASVERIDEPAPVAIEPVLSQEAAQQGIERPVAPTPLPAPPSPRVMPSGVTTVEAAMEARADVAAAAQVPAPASIVAPQAAPEAAPIEAVVAPPPAVPVTTASTPQLDPAALQSVVEQAGLQWVQTAPSAAPVEPEVPAPVRAPRVRKPRAAPVSEPLVQVETGADRKPD